METVRLDSSRLCPGQQRPAIGSMTRIALRRGCLRNDRDGWVHNPAGGRPGSALRCRTGRPFPHNIHHRVDYIGPCYTRRFPSAYSAAAQVGADGRVYAELFYPSLKYVWPEMYHTPNIQVVQVRYRCCWRRKGHRVPRHSSFLLL